MTSWVKLESGLIVPEGRVEFQPPEPPRREPVHYKVTLRDTRDGFTRTFDWECAPNHADPAEELHSVRWFWEEGNYGCDCNRSMRLYPDDESKWLECNGPQIIELVSIEECDVPCGGVDVA